MGPRIPLHPGDPAPKQQTSSVPPTPTALIPNQPHPRLPGIYKRGLSFLRVDFTQTPGLESHLLCILKSAAHALQALRSPACPAHTTAPPRPAPLQPPLCLAAGSALQPPPPAPHALPPEASGPVLPKSGCGEQGSGRLTPGAPTLVLPCTGFVTSKPPNLLVLQDRSSAHPVGLTGHGSQVSREDGRAHRLASSVPSQSTYWSESAHTFPLPGTPRNPVTASLRVPTNLL